MWSTVWPELTFLGTAERALDWNVLICVCALQLSHKPLIVKLPLAVVRFLFPLEQNFQTEEEDITRGTPEM